MSFKRPRFWLVIGVLAAFWMGVGTIWSYVRTAEGELRRSIKDAVPIAFELKRLQQMTDDLIPELQANQKVAAQLDVEVEYLDREIAAMQAGQEEGKRQMQKLRETLRNEQASYDFGGTPFTRREVEDDLGRRLAKYDDTQVQLEAKRRIQETRRRTLQAATDKIRQYRHQRDLLEEKSASLQAELKTVELAQAAGTFHFDHSKLKEAKDLAMEVEKRIRTLHKLVESEQTVVGEIPVEADGRSSTEKFDEYFADR